MNNEDFEWYFESRTKGGSKVSFESDRQDGEYPLVCMIEVSDGMWRKESYDYSGVRMKGCKSYLDLVRTAEFSRSPGETAQPSWEGYNKLFTKGIPDEKWAIVEKSISKLLDITREHEESVKGLMLEPESPLNETFNMASELAMSTLSELVGDTEEWILWYCIDNEFGRRSLELTTKHGHIFKINNTDGLRRLIESEL